MTSRIHKESANLRVKPNLADYEATRMNFSWEDARRELAGLPGGRGLNIAYETVDRHVDRGSGHGVALRFLRLDGTIEDKTFADLSRESNRFANVLRHLGVEAGERVFALSGRVPDLYVTALGTLKNKSVFCPLFSAFGPEPIFQRLSRGDARVLVTDRRLYEKKIRPIRERLGSLSHVLLVDSERLGDEALSFPEEMARSSKSFVIPDTDPEDMALPGRRTG